MTKILVADDEADLEVLIRQKFRQKIREQKYEFLFAANGKEAMSKLEQNPGVDIVLSDINMPEMKGYEVCEQLKSHPDLAAAPVIFLSALNATEDKVKAFQTGGADYINKPFQLEEVQARIQTHLKLGALQQTLRQQNDQLEEIVSQRTRQLEVAVERIRSMYDQTLRALGGALDLRDNETAGHSQRVTRYSLEIAQAMACSEEELGEIALGASLHDIGKIGIPDAILLKPGKLSAEETEIMRRHVSISYELVSQHLFLSHAAQIVLTHHESYDGSGYPQGLIGKEIPLGARIFAVADTMDAMTSDRPYRAALPYQIAREEIARCSGSQFDPDVVQVFLSIPEEIWKRIRIRSCFETLH